MKKIITKIKEFGSILSKPSLSQEFNEPIKFERIDISKSEYISLSPYNIVYIPKFSNKIQAIVAMTNQWSQLFGKHNFTYKGEYNCKNWTFKDNRDNYFFIVSAPGRGTSLESTIDLQDYYETGKISKDTKYNIDCFVDFLYDNLLTLDDEKVKFWSKL